MFVCVCVCVCVQDYTPEDRKQFLKFVWGRTRLPATEADWGSHTFKITKHQHAENAVGDAVNNFFPIAHTCFFQLELPRYTTREAMKVRTAIKLCWRVHVAHAYMCLCLGSHACCTPPAIAPELMLTTPWKGVRIWG